MVHCNGCTETSLLDLLPETSPGEQFVQRVSWMLDGQATLTCVPPGRYRIQVRAQGASDLKTFRSGVELDGQDVTVELDTAATPAMRGTVSMEDGRPIPKGLLIRLYEWNTARSYTRAIAPDGNFSVPGMPPGSYGIYLAGVPAVYAGSIRLSGRETRILQMPDAANGALRVVARIGLGRVAGFASTSRMSGQETTGFSQ